MQAKGIPRGLRQSTTLPGPRRNSREPLAFRLQRRLPACHEFVVDPARIPGVALDDKTRCDHAVERAVLPAPFSRRPVSPL